MGVRRLAVANGPNIFQMLLVFKFQDFRLKIIWSVNAVKLKHHSWVFKSTTVYALIQPWHLGLTRITPRSTDSVKSPILLEFEPVNLWPQLKSKFLNTMHLVSNSDVKGSLVGSPPCRGRGGPRGRAPFSRATPLGLYRWGRWRRLRVDWVLEIFFSTQFPLTSWNSHRVEPPLIGDSNYTQRCY